MYAGVTVWFIFIAGLSPLVFNTSLTAITKIIIQAFKVSKNISSYLLKRAQEKFLKEMQEEVRGVLLEVHT